MLAFGPDKLLYVGIASATAAARATSTAPAANGQNLSVLFGKILRIDPEHPAGERTYEIPSSNPFAHRSGDRGEIYAYGLRNPWRFSFDRSTGDLIIGDVGQDQVEEVDFARRGKARGVNYGWRVWEGRRRNAPSQAAPNAVFPVLTKNHSAGWCSIVGGYVVRDPSLPALRGQYVYGDYCQGQVRAVRLSTGRATGDRQLALPKVGQISSFGEDAAGHVYVVDLGGPVLPAGGRLDDDGGRRGPAAAREPQGDRRHEHHADDPEPRRHVGRAGRERGRERAAEREAEAGDRCPPSPRRATSRAPAARRARAPART